MKYSLAILAAAISTVTAYPTFSKRQNGCPLDQFGKITVIAAADPSSTTRWDIFANPGGGIVSGDIGFFNRAGPDANELFTAAAGSASNLFTFQGENNQNVGLSGSTLAVSETATTFKVTCSECNDVPAGNALAASGCTFETTDGTTGLGQCMTYTGNPANAIMTTCDTSSVDQQFIIFTQ